MRYELKEAPREAPREPLSESECKHYWLIEGAGGPTSRGVCKFCGAEKEFHNSWPYFATTKENSNVVKPPDLPDIEAEEEWEDSEAEEDSADL